MNLHKLQEKASTWIMNRIQVLKAVGGHNEEMDALDTAKMALDRITAIKAITPNSSDEYACPRCGHHFEGKQHYCHNCGQHVSYRGTEDQKYTLITHPAEVDIKIFKGKFSLEFGGTVVSVPLDMVRDAVGADGVEMNADGEISYKSYH